MRQIFITLFCFITAIANGQTPRQLTDYFQTRRKMCEVTPDSIFPTIRQLERMRLTAKDSVTWAVLSECLGQLYENNVWMAQHNSIGESIEEWGRGQWRDAAKRCFDDARTPLKALREARAKRWRPAVSLFQPRAKSDTIVGSRWFDDDLLHVFHHARPTDEVARFYADRVGGASAVMARLWVEGADCDSLLRVAESDNTVPDVVRALVFMELALGKQNADTCVEMCEECIRRYGYLPVCNRVRNTLNEMRRPFLSVEWPQRVYPGREYRVPVRYRNIQGIDLTIGQETKILPTRDEPAHKTVIDTLTLMAPMTGAYKIKVSPKVTSKVDRVEKSDTCTMYVSALRLLRLTAPRASDPRFMVVDAISGAPVEGARIDTYLQRVTRGRRVTESKMVRIVGDPQPAVEYFTGTDYNPVFNEFRRTDIHTDRAIYRPGQTVRLSAIRYAQKHWDARVDADVEMCLEILDPKGKVCHADTVVTDAYGCASCEYVLPSKAALGRYSVRLGNDYYSFVVEEYKRPTFAVEMADSLRDDTVDVVVTAFNGVPVRGARVTGEAILRTWWRYDADSRCQVLDTLFTDVEGRVRIPVTLPVDEKERHERMLEVSISVVAATGETRDDTHVYGFGNISCPVAPDTMPRDTVAWFRCLNDTLFSDRPARVEVGSAAADVHLFMSVFRDNDCVRQEEIVFGDSLFTIDFTDALLDGHPESDGLSVAMAFMKDGRVYSETFRLYRPQPDRRLRWEWYTFRDRVRPGDKEVWTGRLITPDGRPADANAMFTVYDASLDEFAKHFFSLDLWRGYTLPNVRYANLFTPYSHNATINAYNTVLRVPLIGYHSLSDHLSLRGYYTRGAELMVCNTMARPMKAASGRVYKSELMEECCDDSCEEVAGNAPDAAGREQAHAVSVRENFSETAYFVPSLRTDSQGRVTLRFMLPDAVTTWRVMGIAHTKDMLTANISANTVARKELMVLVDVPRLVRQGDCGTAAVTVQNIAGKRQDVTLSIDLLDADTEEVLRSESHRFALMSDTVVRTIAASDRDFIVRAVVRSSGGSDGEQRLVPVLDGSMWVARSIDLQCRGVGIHDFDVDSLFNESSLENRVTLHYTESPIWTAVDVLRNIAMPEHDDVISLHTALYATALTRHLALNHPEVASFLNFDADSALMTINDVAKRLDAMRNRDGGYAWFPGFESSEWITADVGTTLARLKAMTGEERVELADIISYLDDCNHRRVERMKKDSVRHVPGLAMQYLYIKALAGYTHLDTDARYIIKLLVGQCADADKTMTREDMALASVLLGRLGYEKESEELRLAMRRYLVTTPRQGTSFSYLRGSFTSIDRKLLAHIHAMEALRPADTLLCDMRRHLLLQKRVQAWENPLVNASAVYALLLGDEIPLATPREHDIMMLMDDSERLIHSEAVADGQIKLTRRFEEAISSVRIDKRTPQESWGAVYVETRQPLEGIRPHGSELVVRRHCDTTAVVGQEAQTRLVLHADRDYECVHVTVPRAACMEPVNTVSRCHYQSGLVYYHEVRDEADHLFISRLPKGDYVLTLDAYVVRPGRYNAPPAQIQCMYAPEFCGNTANEVVRAEPAVRDF